MADRRAEGRGEVERASARPATILDVAARAGVSKSVVSRVLTQAPGVAAATRERVLHAADELGYVPNTMAQAMVARRTGALGAFVRDASTPFYGHLLTLMQDRAAELGYRVVTATGSGRFSVADERRALDVMTGLRVEGLVICSGLLPERDVEEVAAKVPTVVAGRPLVSDACGSVFCDEAGGGRGVAEHVNALGHRRVAVLVHSPDLSLTLSPRSRAAADRLTGLGADVVRLPVHDFWRATHEDVDAVVAAALDAGATALVLPSDRLALRALEALRVRGLKAPGDLSVTGYDGFGELASPFLGLTTWRQPLPTIARMAVDSLVGLVQGRVDGLGATALAGELVVGRTASTPA